MRGRAAVVWLLVLLSLASSSNAQSERARIVDRA
jgi:hypothetical protein